MKKIIAAIIVLFIVFAVALGAESSFSKEKIPDFQSVHREITAITVMMNWCILKPGSTGYMAGEKTEGSLNVPKILAGSKSS